MTPLSQLYLNTLVECQAQLTRFVVRKQMTSPEAAALSKELALALVKETLSHNEEEYNDFLIQMRLK